MHESVRNKRVGSLLVEYFVKLAPMIGYEAAFFNLVFTDNLPSIKMWERMGFTRTGTIPKAAKHSNGNYQDAYQYYIEFKE